MNPRRWITDYLKSVDWPLLIFLLGVTSVKLPVKIVTLFAYGVYLFIRKVPLNNHKSGPVKFYLLMPLVGLVGALCLGAFQVRGYWFGAALSTLIWMLCALAFVLVSMSMGRLDREKLQKTIAQFFMLNILVCFAELVQMAIVSRHIFPYWYTELDFIYGVSTGDHLHGLFQDNSTVNAAVSMLGLFYFLFARRYGMAFLCLATCLLCTSNLTVAILLLLVGFTFVFFRKQRKAMLVTGLGTIALYIFISPSNIHYAQRVVNKVNTQIDALMANTHNESSISRQEAADTVRLDVNTTAADSTNETQIVVHQKPIRLATQECVQREPFPMETILHEFSGPIVANLGTTSLYLKEHIPEDTNALRRVMRKWYGVPYDSLPIAMNPRPGKILYLKQTGSFLKSGIAPFLFGAGPGNFSSKLAIKMTGFHLQGNYPERYRYMSRTYFENSFYVYMYFWAKSVQDRSIINYPGSVYWQIGGEYGMIGLGCFFLLYIGFFVRRAMSDKKKLVFILALLILFLLDYWMEMLTITVLFELFMLSPLNDPDKEAAPARDAAYQSPTERA